MSAGLPNQACRSDPQPHRHRGVAESFGTDVDRYDRTRPSYPDALIERIVAASPGRDVLDVGCGTGIEARQFQAAGCTVLGVEPDARMAEFARRSGVEVEVATFEAWDPAGRQFDAVIAGTAWHWVDPVAGAAKAATVLRPGGLLAPFHHVHQPPPEVGEALAAAYRQAVPDSPLNLTSQLIHSALDAYQSLFTKITDGIRTAGGFSEPEQWQFDWERRYTRDEWLDHLPTLGGLTQLPRTSSPRSSTASAPPSTRSAAPSPSPTPPWPSPRHEPALPDRLDGLSAAGGRRLRRLQHLDRRSRRGWAVEGEASAA